MNIIVFTFLMFYILFAFDPPIQLFFLYAVILSYIIGLLCYFFPEYKGLKLFKEDALNLKLKNYSLKSLKTHFILFIRGTMILLKVNNKKL